MNPPNFRVPAFKLATLRLLSVLILSVAPVSWAGLKAGGIVTDITPLPEHFPISVNGSMSERFVELTEERIHARTIAVADADTTVTFTVVDSCVLLREVVDAAKQLASEKTGIPADQMMISATHCHSAPTVTPVFQSSVSEPYQKWLPDKIAESIADAVAKLQPCEVGWAVGENSAQAFNRRWFVTEPYENPFGSMGDKVRMNPGYNRGGGKASEPAGPTDPSVPVLAFRSVETGQPVALLSNYCLHYVGSPPLNSTGKAQLSGDYFARFADIMAEKVAPGNPDFVAVMSNGTSGDINNIDYSRESGYRRAPGEQMQIVARAIAHTARGAFETIEYQKDAPVEVVTRELSLGVRKPTAEEVTRADEILNSTEKLANGQLSAREAIYARETLFMKDYPDTVPVKLMTIRIGDLCINTLPCETFVETGLELRESSPFGTTFTIELANGYNGYLPTPQQHEWGGYETWRARSSYLEKDASVKIVKAFKEMMAEVKKGS